MGLDKGKLDSSDVILVSAPAAMFVWIGKGRVYFNIITKLFESNIALRYLYYFECNSIY